MTKIEQLASILNVAQITDDYRGRADLEISEWNTADGYGIHVITNDPHNIDWENDVYYYEPSFETVIDRIRELDDEFAIVYISDIDTYIPEYEVDALIEEHELELINLENEK